MAIAHFCRVSHLHFDRTSAWSTVVQIRFVRPAIVRAFFLFKRSVGAPCSSVTACHPGHGHLEVKHACLREHVLSPCEKENLIAHDNVLTVRGWVHTVDREKYCLHGQSWWSEIWHENWH